MPSNMSPAEVARELRTTLATSGRASRRMRSLTFWRLFGVLRRTPASVERVLGALAAEGLVAYSSGNTLGTESHVDWVTIGMVEQGAWPASPHVPFAAESTERSVIRPTVSPTLVEQRVPTSRGAGAERATAANQLSPPTWRRIFARVRAFATHHPIAFTLGLLCTSGLALIASIMAVLTVLSLLIVMNVGHPRSVETAMSNSIAAPETHLPGNASLQAGDSMESSKVLPPPTATPPPSSSTSALKHPDETPPIDIDPQLTQRCDSFPNYDTMKAWRDHWQARDVANPGRLDGDADGLACEAGEGGRPPAPTMTPSGWTLKHGITLWEDDFSGEGIRILAEIKAGTVCTPLAGKVGDCCPGLGGIEYYWHFTKMRCGSIVGWATEDDLVDWK